MSMFLESPWPAIVLGAIGLGLLGVAYHNTADRRLLRAMGGVVVVMLLLLLLQWVVVTDREAVGNTLDDMAVALESNDLDRVLAYLAPEAEKMRADALQYLPGVEVSDANVGRDLDVTINRFTNPPTARATFTGRITGVNRNPSERNLHDTFVRRFTLKLRRENSRWVVTDYEMGGIR